MDGHHITDP